MTAATAPRGIIKRVGESAVHVLKSYPVKGGAKIFSGTLVVLNAGYAQPASAALGLEPVGIAEISVGGNVIDNTTGGDGAVEVQVRAGPHGPYASGAGADAITQANAGQDCYMIDDSTVGLTDGQGTRSWAGRIDRVDPASASNPYTPGGIIVEFGSRVAPAQQQRMEIPVNIDLASLANDQVLDFGAMPWAGRIVGMRLVTGKPATSGGAGTVTLTPNIAPSPGFVAAPITGGVVVAALAAMAAQGANVPGTAVTGLNSFKKGDKVQVIASALTAFTGGTATVLVDIG